jgi:acetyltransferase-like isoleucine patch superfamily enzyme
MNHSSEYLGDSVLSNVKFCGRDVSIFPFAKISKPEVIEIGDCSRIDDFTFTYGGQGIIIGRYVHIACFSSIVGGGHLSIGDYVVIGYGVRLITGTDTYQGGKRMSTALPASQRNIIRGKIVIEKDAFIGANSIVHPNVTVGEGAIIGSNSVVLHDIEPWTINVGSPCKKIKMRPRVIEQDI